MEPLSSRELEVYKVFVDHDCSRKETASELGISYHTVATHIENIYQKTGVHRALAVAKKRGWLTMPEVLDNPI